ncbi:FAD-dependent oxidoreductase [Sphaerisporangium aureirubrum]|uniref:FAD-dependent oxidoreductase n=1 Tax=Sphaerisporangium aureirubrum TaxID=1544736 RepID=A0ABW1NBB9_9ACTN
MNMSGTCVIAGGGPAGAVLGLLLARSGIEVTLLEKHKDFLRDFRGDTLHPSTLQVMDELGLADRVAALPHRKTTAFWLFTDDGRRTPVASLKGLKSKYPYIAFVPQWDFLNLVTEAAREYPNFRLIMEAEVTGVIREGGAAKGVRYRDAAGEHELRATLTVGADGRGSDVRRAAGLVPVERGAPMDVVWFRLPREPGDFEDSFLRVSSGNMMVAINRETYWQLAYLIPKGAFEKLKAQGIEELRASVARLLPFLAPRTGELEGFGEVGVLRVALNRLRHWYRPGLLLIGDAAHAMSPIFGVGINLAVQDAVATANILAEPLREGHVPVALLRKIQRRRTLPTVITQSAQQFVQNRLIRPALDGSRGPTRLPFNPSRVPLLTAVARRFLGLGVLPEHVRTRPHPPSG